MSEPLPIMVVGDGPRDAAMLPPLVSRVLGTTVQAVGERGWHGVRLTRGGGYDRKLRFVMREAVESGARGLVATVDRDKSPKRSRLADLVKARETERQDVRSPAAQLAVALGEADPHAEAWLLDDAVAVRSALGLGASAAIPNVRKVAPKDALDVLFGGRELDERPVELLARIAGLVDSSRCVHARETGLHSFCDEVRTELGQFVAHGDEESD